MMKRKNLLIGAVGIFMALTGTACNNASANSAESVDSAAVAAQADSVADEAGKSKYVFRPGKKVKGEKLVALTFDDGPNGRATEKVLATLKKYDVPATFFVTGQCIKGNEARMRKAVEQGCEICSHTWTHPFLSICSQEKIDEELSKTNEAIKDAVGYYPNFFRPPYIDCDQGVLDMIDMPGVSGVDSDDWMTKNSPETIYNIVMRRVKPDAIFIMHDLAVNDRTPRALEKIIPALKAQGYTFVTVTDMFTTQGVTPEPGHLYVSPSRSDGAIPEKATYRVRKGKKSAGGAKNGSAAAKQGGKAAKQSGAAAKQSGKTAKQGGKATKKGRKATKKRR